MADPLRKTLDLLARTTNTRAVDVLAGAMEGLDEARVGAAEALLRRGSARAQAAFVTRCEALTGTDRERLKRYSSLVDDAIDRSLLAGAEDVRSCALAEVRRVDRFDRLESVLKLRDIARGNLSDEAEETARHLVERLHELRSATDGYVESQGRHIDDLRRDVLTTFESVVEQREDESLRDLAIDSILRLGHPDDPAVRSVLWDGSEEVRRLGAARLRRESHPGAMRLILDSLATPYPHPVVFECIRERIDPPFVEALLRWLPATPTRTQRSHLKQIGSVAFLTPERVAELPADLQARAVRFVECTGVEKAVRRSLLDWIIRNGTAEGREAASGYLAELDASESREIVFEGLAHEDTATQAWAMAQLRPTGVAEAMTLLVQRLDDESEEVREAAQRELQGFGLDLLFRIHDHLPADVRRSVGGIVRKIDPNHANKLRNELRHPVHQRRVNAIRATANLGLQYSVIEEFLVLLQDPDHVLRRMAAEVLGTIPQPAVVLALRARIEDPHQRVRDAVNASLGRIREFSEASRSQNTLQETAS